MRAVLVAVEPLRWPRHVTVWLSQFYGKWIVAVALLRKVWSVVLVAA
jgi:hypothetical protein